MEGEPTSDHRSRSRSQSNSESSPSGPLSRETGLGISETPNEEYDEFKDGEIQEEVEEAEEGFGDDFDDFEEGAEGDEDDFGDFDDGAPSPEVASRPEPPPPSAPDPLAHLVSRYHNIAASLHRALPDLSSTMLTYCICSPT